MAGMDDLFKGAEMFADAMSQYQITQATNDARKQLDSLNKAELEKGELFQRTAQVGQDLALRLTGAGASPQRIQEATQALAPSASVQAQSMGNIEAEKQKMESTAKGSPAGLEKTKSETQLEVARIHANTLLGKNATKEANDMSKYITDFAKQPQNKALFEGITKLDDVMQILNQTGGKMGATMGTEMAKIGVLTSLNKRINLVELTKADPTPSVMARVWREAGLQTTGEVPKNIQEFWPKFVGGLKQQMVEKLRQAKEGHVEGANPNWDREALRKMADARYAAHLGGPAQSAGGGASAEADHLEEWAKLAEAGQIPNVRKDDPRIKQAKDAAARKRRGQ